MPCELMQVLSRESADLVRDELSAGNRVWVGRRHQRLLSHEIVARSLAGQNGATGSNSQPNSSARMALILPQGSCASHCTPAFSASRVTMSNISASRAVTQIQVNASI